MNRTVSLYGGTRTINFADDGHGYFIKEKNKAAPGVTEMIKVTTDKPALAQWRVNVALEYVGKQLASGRKDITTILEEAKGEHRRISKGAADRGHMVHSWLERWMETPGKVEYPQDEQGRRACMACEKWFTDHDVKVLDRERIIYSDSLHYAGTMDLYAEINGELSLVDFKTSSSATLYREMPLQLAAYAVALDEELSTNHTNGWVIILDKKTGTVSPHYVPLNTLKDTWKSCVSWYWKLGVLDYACDEIKLATSEGRRAWSEQPTFTQALAASLEQQTLLKTPSS